MEREIGKLSLRIVFLVLTTLVMNTFMSCEKPENNNGEDNDITIFFESGFETGDFSEWGNPNTIFHDDDILRAVATELAREGIEIVSSTTYLPELIAPPGSLTRRRPNKAENEDIYFGWEVAKELGRMDIGQCVVVRSKTVLALEAIDGTDETILRGGRLAKKNAVVVKVSKPNQDLRFDVPSVGLNTVRVMSEVKASALAVEAGKTLMFEKSEMIKYANRAGIAIISR